MEQFLNQNASAIFALVGALGAALLTSSGSWLISRREYNFRLWEKLLDRRIKAHESVIAVALDMRVMVALGGTDGNGEVARTPKILLSKENFEAWFTKFTHLTLEGSTWLTTKTKRELNYAQDYLVNLHMNLSGTTDAQCSQIGQVVRQDFINLSSSLEKTAFQYFASDLRKLRLNDLNDWHKYPIEETERRLTASALRGNIGSIERIKTASAR